MATHNFENLSLNETNPDETKAVKPPLLSYCSVESCKGNPINIDYEEIEGTSECPICYESLDSKRVSLLPCNHAFCVKCIHNCARKQGCPLCREKFKEILTFNKAVKYTFKNRLPWDVRDHCLCSFDSCPAEKELLGGLGKEWKSLIGFVAETQINPQLYKEVAGIKHLNLKKYKDEGRLLKMGLCHAVIQRESGDSMIIFACYMPCMSMRLLVLPNDGEDFGQDDGYADWAVGHMDRQLRACWRSFTSLLNKDYVDHMLVRRFENVTCLLLLTGSYSFPLYSYKNHYLPSRKELQGLKVTNFDESLLDGLRELFPLCDFSRGSYKASYLASDCCPSTYDDDNDDDDDDDDDDNDDDDDDFGLD